MYKNIFFIIFIIIGLYSCKSQKKVRFKELYAKAVAELDGSNQPIDTVNRPTLELTRKKEKKEEERKKKIGRTVFYGFKTRRAYAKKGKNNKREWELFYVLKKPVDPSIYTKDLYWYDRRKRMIKIGKIEPADMKNAKILHGPYLKKQGKKIMEEGIFFIGSKHGRWVKYDKNNLLVDKKRFYKGFATDSEITYYDIDQKKVKEVIPIQWGTKEGEYFYYDYDGNLLKYGLYKENARVGMWYEYFTNGKKKSEIQYPKDPFDKTTPPYVAREFSDKGKVLYDYRKHGAKPDSVNAKWSTK
ncbi:MAG: hypothetical protein NW207_09615 [Cytophagales bacterium]|nr:hypothetical protein [Cytophagales bacterium]